jgi:DHA2 family multidrug resistance protein-like MFS transporter
MNTETIYSDSGYRAMTDTEDADVAHEAMSNLQLTDDLAGVDVPAPRRASRREWIGLGVIALPCLLYSMDLTVLDLAVPRLSAELHPSSAQLLWIVDIYGFILAGMLIPMGALGDRIGRRRLLLIGATAFGLASIGAALTQSASMLILARAVLGVAGATLAPSTLSLIRNLFLDPHERTRAIGLWITSYSVGGAIGPLVGGLLLDHFSWRSAFLIGVPIMVLLLVIGPILLPEFRDPNARRIDVLSTVMSITAVLLVIYGVKQIALANAHVLAFAAIVLGLVIGVAFVRRQRVLTEPVIDPSLFANRALSVSLLSYGTATLAGFGIYLVLVQYLQLVQELSPFAAGLTTLPVFMGFTGGAMLTPVLTKHTRPVVLMVGGLVISAIGFAIFGFATPTTPLTVLLVASGLYALGLSPVTTLATDLIVGAAPPERAGSAAALSETGSELGGALGVALLGSAGSAYYRAAMTHALPSGLSADAFERARNTLGGAMAVAKQIGGATGERIDTAARIAFTHSFNLTSWLCAAVLLATALLLYVALPAAKRA